MDLEAFTERSRQTWDEMAAGWEVRHEFLERNMGLVNDWIIERADPRPGQIVVDVAAGPGDLGHRIALLVGLDGRVISTDFAPEMVAVAERVGASRGLENVEYRQLDAERMDLGDGEVDAVVCRSGYMLMADPGRAFAEANRVLRPDDSLVFAVFTSPDRNPWAAVPAATLIARGHLQPPEPGSPGVFALGNPDRIRDLVTGAGFNTVRIEAIDFVFHYQDADDAWNAVLGLNGPMAVIIGALSPHEREATRMAVVDRYAQHRQPDGSYPVPAQAWGVLASR